MSHDKRNGNVEFAAPTTIYKRYDDEFGGDDGENDDVDSVDGM